MNHDNICRFIGAVLDAPKIMILHVYCNKGSLQVIHTLVNLGSLSSGHKKFCIKLHFIIHLYNISIYILLVESIVKK